MHLLEDNFKDLEEFLNRFLGNNQEPFLQSLESKSFFEALPDIYKNIAKSLQDSNRIKYLIDFLHIFLENYDKIILQSGICNLNLFTKVKNTLKVVSEKSESKCKEICSSYINTYRTKYPVPALTINLLLFQKNYDQFLKLLTTKPLNKLGDYFESFLLKLIEENQEEQFHSYFFDWILKFGYLIEAHIKEVLITQLKFAYFLKKEDFKKIPKKELTIGPLINKLKGNPTISLFRNSIFHTSFLIDYKVNLEERKLIFKDWKGRKKELSIKEFIGNYFKLIQMVQTYLLSISSFYFNIYKDKIIEGVTKAFTQDLVSGEDPKSSLVTDEEVNNRISKLKDEFKKEFGFD